MESPKEGTAGPLGTLPRDSLLGPRQNTVLRCRYFGSVSFQRIVKIFIVHLILTVMIYIFCGTAGGYSQDYTLTSRTSTGSTRDETRGPASPSWRTKPRLASITYAVPSFRTCAQRNTCMYQVLTSSLRASVKWYMQPRST